MTIGSGSGAYEVTREGENYVILAACDAAGTTTAALPALDLDLSVSFRNPYGFLPGQVYGYLPFYGTLFVGYCLLGLFFLVALVRHRKYLLSLQWLILGVIVLGTVEMASWFFMYESKNRSGIPTPCNVCPTTSDYMTAVVLNVGKRAISRVLLLAVCLGFGVVYPSLDRRTALVIAAMGAAYFGCGVANDVSRETAYDASGPSAWELPILALDLLFSLGIYWGLAKTRRDLATAGQAAKLQMYTRLLRVLIGNVVAWFAVTLVLVAIRARAVPVPWQSLFFLVNFWDALYLLVLLAIAWIWLPGPEAFNYAWYSQGASNEADAEADEEASGIAPRGADVEMAAARKVAREMEEAGEVPPEGVFAIGSHEEGDGRRSTKSPAAAAGGRGAKSPAAAMAAPGSARSAQRKQEKQSLSAAAAASLDVNEDDLALDLEDDDDDAALDAAAAAAAAGGAGGLVDDDDDDLDLDLGDGAAAPVASPVRVTLPGKASGSASKPAAKPAATAAKPAGGKPAAGRAGGKPAGRK